MQLRRTENGPKNGPKFQLRRPPKQTVPGPRSRVAVSEQHHPCISPVFKPILAQPTLGIELQKISQLTLFSNPFGHKSWFVPITRWRSQPESVLV
jgi:hypothetical protein